MKQLLLALYFLGGGMLAGQASQDTGTMEPAARDGILCLSLEDAIALALENNLDVELQRIGRRLAETDIARARAGERTQGLPFSVREGPRSVAGGGLDMAAPSAGAGSEFNFSVAGQTSLSPGSLLPSLDPVVSAGLSRNHSTALQVNSFQSGTTALVSDTTAWNFSLRKGFLSGGTLTADFENDRRSINSPRYDLSSFNTASLGISFTQPLLKGFGSRLNSRYIRIAANGRRQSDLVFRQQVISTTAAVIRLYWDLVALQGDVEARSQALRRAEKLLADNQEQVEVGMMAPIESVRARAEVARSRRDLISAEGLVRQQETVLKDYVSRKTAGDPSLSGIRIVPTDSLPAGDSWKEQDLQALGDEALETRPDIAAARLQIENTQMALAGSKDATRPALDLILGARNHGLAGEVNELVIPGASPHNPDPTLVGGYGSALSQVFRRNFPDYGVGVRLTLPLGNRAAEADYARDRVALRQQELRLMQLRKQVHVEIRNAWIALQQARAALESARQEREFQEQALTAEEEKMSVGATTTYLVIQYQRDLAAARSAEIASLAACAKAGVALQRASGRLLEAHGISMGEAQERTSGD